MIASVLAGLAALSLALLLWQWLEGLWFPVHRRGPVPADAPAVTLLKPLKGADAETAACLRSWFAQDYPGPVELLFGIHTPDDPAGDVVRALQREFPQASSRLVVCPERLGPNSKVSKLAQLEPLARHGLLVISDADVWVPADFLCQLVRPFDAAEVALVNPLYGLATPSTPAMRWEALAVNADFWTSVLQARRLGPLRFALGAVMAVRRDALRGIGGFTALLKHLADDYELGRRVASRGGRIELCPVVATCRESARSWGAVWRHQVRWTRTIRHCQPVPFAFSLLSNATLWPLLWLAASRSGAALAGFAVCLVARLAMAAHCQWRLTQSWQHLPWVWLAPIKDLLAAVLWGVAFVGNTVEWRGEGFRVQPGGELKRLR
jgi:ceramide glucosyltransferase